MEQTAEFLTLKEVCTLLRIGERTAYELCRTGRMGGAVKVGGVWRIEQRAFRRWVEQGGGPVPSSIADQDGNDGQA